MHIRKSTTTDINEILSIIEDAKAALKGGGVDQWQTGYPNREVIEKDISDGVSYVLEEEGRILGTIAVTFDGEETYNTVYQGSWLSPPGTPYATIHRLATATAYKKSGYAKILCEHCISLCRDMGIGSAKVDTHRNNVAMRSLLEGFGFALCGIVYIEDGSERIAYEYII